MASAAPPPPHRLDDPHQVRRAVGYSLDWPSRACLADTVVGLAAVWISQAALARRGRRPSPRP